MGLILFVVLIVAVATWYLHVKRKEKQEFLDRYQRYRVGDKGAFVGFNNKPKFRRLTTQEMLEQDFDPAYSLESTNIYHDLYHGDN